MANLFRILVAIWCLPFLDLSSANAENDRNFFRDLNSAIDDILDRENCDQPFLDLQTMITTETFEQRIDAADQAYIYRVLLSCVDVQRDRPALTRFHRAWRGLQLDGEVEWSYRWQLHSLAQWGAYEAAIDLVEDWIERGDFWRQTFDYRSVRNVVRAIEEHAPDHRQPAIKNEFFNLMWENDYRGETELSDLSFYIYDHISVLVELGDLEAAKKIGQRLSNPQVQIRLHLLHKFESVRDDLGLGIDWDITAAYEAHLAKLNSQRLAYPHLIEAHNDYLLLLKALGRDQETITVAERVLAQHDSDPEQFTDRDQQLNWLLNSKAYAHANLGQLDAAIAAFERAIDSGEDGHTNVSQVINLAITLQNAGQHDRAITTLERMGDPSAFGKMFEHRLRACAQHARGQIDLARQTLVLLENNFSDNLSAIQDVYACLGLEEKGAELMIERLSDPNLQDDAFMSMLVPKARPDKIGAGNATSITLRYVLARDDVQSAAAKVGRLVELPIYQEF
ncbi:MAG: tetratricopeptide repeat protein [Pseudomonadota bacterium]